MSVCLQHVASKTTNMLLLISLGCFALRACAPCISDSFFAFRGHERRRSSNSLSTVRSSRHCQLSFPSRCCSNPWISQSHAENQTHFYFPISIGIGNHIEIVCSDAVRSSGNSVRSRIIITC